MAVSEIKAGVILNYVILGLNAITGLLYTPYMLRMLGQNEYGIYSLAASVIAYLSLLDFGFGNAIVRYTSKYRAEGKKEEQYTLFGTFTIIYAGIGLIAFAIGLILYFNVDNMFGNTMSAADLDETRIIMMLMILNVAFAFPLGIYSGIITAYEKFIFVRVVGIVRILFQTAIMVAILYMGYKAVAMVVVQTVISFVVLFINYAYCRKHLDIKLRLRNFQWVLVREISAYSFWIFLNVIMDRIYWSTGQFVLGATVSTIAVSIYSVAITLQGIYMSYSMSIASVMLPRFTSMEVRHASDKDVSDLFIRTGRLQFVILGLLTSGFVVFGYRFIQLWAGMDYSDSYAITVLFFAALIVPLIQNTGITILQARNKMKFRSLLYIVIAAVTLVAQILLAPRYQGLGCAWAIAAALILGQGLIMNIYYYKKQNLDIPRFWKEICRMALVPLVFMTIGLIVFTQVEIEGWGDLAIGICVYLLLYLPAFWRLSLNNYEKDLLRGPLKRILTAFSR